MEWSPYHEIFRLRGFGKGKSSFFIESQVCNKCLKDFSPEIVLSKHLSICRGPVFEDFEEMLDFYKSFFESDDYYGDY